MSVRKNIKGFLKEAKASVSADNIIKISIALFILAAILPSAITTLATTNTTGWSSATVTVWNIIPLVVVAGFVVALYELVKKKK